MKVKTADLKGRALDWVVADIDRNLAECSPEVLDILLNRQNSPLPVFDYSNNWDRTGPLIEANSPVITILEAKIRTEISTLENDIYSKGIGLGLTYLESFLRAFASLHKGDEVDIPESLLGGEYE